MRQQGDEMENMKQRFYKLTCIKRQQVFNKTKQKTLTQQQQQQQKRQKINKRHEKWTYPKKFELSLSNASRCDGGCQSSKIEVKNEL